MVPSRTSSLHSRITQPVQPQGMKPSQRTPKTLTHAYMVCGVGREPSQWVRAPSPAQGKIGHMKGAVGQFWLPEILGSSPRLEQDNEIARALHSAMRVSLLYICMYVCVCVVVLTRTGMLPSRRGNLHRKDPAALRSPCLRPAAGLFPHAVRCWPACLVAR